MDYAILSNIDGRYELQVEIALKPNVLSSEGCLASLQRALQLQVEIVTEGLGRLTTSIYSLHLSGRKEKPVQPDIRYLLASFHMILINCMNYFWRKNQLGYVQNTNRAIAQLRLYSRAGRSYVSKVSSDGYSPEKSNDNSATLYEFVLQVHPCSSVEKYKPVLGTTTPHSNKKKEKILFHSKYCMLFSL